MNKRWIRTLVVSWFALILLAPAVHAVDGGDGPDDVCRQAGSSVACGQDSTAGTWSTAVGRRALAPGQSNVAIGFSAEADGGGGANVAIGGAMDVGGSLPTVATGGGSVALGAAARAESEGAIALGQQSEASGSGTVTIGQSARGIGQRSVVLGQGSTDDGKQEVVSFGSQTLQRDLIHVRDITSTGQISAVGFRSTGQMDAGSAIVRNGLSVNAGGASIVGGIDANNGKVTGVAAGDVVAGSTDAVNGGQLFQTNQSVQVAQADALAALAGLEQLVNELMQTGVCQLSGGTMDCSTNLQLGGATVHADADHAVALGTGASVQSSGGIAMGHNAGAAEGNAVAIGTDAQAMHENSIAIGSGSTTSAPNTVSVGAEGNERRITHVAAGVVGTDAVNVDQLHAAVAGAGTLAFTAAKEYTDQEVAALRTSTARGIAAAVAMMNVQPSAVGKTAVSVGVGHYSGETALGLSLTRAAREDVLWSFGAAASLGGETAMRGGFSMEF